MKFTYKQIKACIKELGLLELYDLESTINKEFEERRKKGNFIVFDEAFNSRKLACSICMKKNNSVRFEGSEEKNICDKCLNKIKQEDYMKGGLKK